MGSCPEHFIQVNTVEEPQKPGEMPADTDDFVAESRALDLPERGISMAGGPGSDPDRPPRLR
jgi:uncharacterized pyridoxal phosphate-containing UPF0001 family protein